MASRELSILVTAKNMASRVLGQVKGDVNGLSSAASKAGSNVGRNVGIATAAVAAGLAVQVKAGVDSLVELERVENLTEAALKSTGNAANQSVKGIRARAEALEGLTGVDDKVIQNAENLLLTFANISEKAFEPTLESAINLNAALGGDDDSLQGVLLQVAKAVNDPVRGMTALRRSGVSFTEAQQKQVKALVEANDLMGAQAIVLGELDKQFGGAAEAANQGATRAQRRWADAVEDIQKSLATGFMPLIERVSEKMTQLVADPSFLPAVEKFGESLASGFDDAIDFAESVDWGAIGSALSTAGAGARAVMDAFLGAPPWLQTAILTGWGLNKLTGGLAGSLIGELGKGLIKGVLGMNAGVVNINAGVVNGGGGGVGVPAAAGGAGLLALLGTGAAAAAGLAAVTVAGTEVHRAVDPTGHQFNELASQKGVTRVQVEGDLLSLSRDTGLSVDRLREMAIPLLSEANSSWPEVVAGLREVQRQQAQTAVNVTRGTTALQQRIATEGARAAGSDRAMLNTAITTQGVAFHQRRLAEAAASSDRAMLSTAATQASRLATIQSIEGGNASRLETIKNKKSSVTAVINTTVNVSLQEWQRRQISSIRASSGSGGFI
jgi:hypothetical protein